MKPLAVIVAAAGLLVIVPALAAAPPGIHHGPTIRAVLNAPETLVVEVVEGTGGRCVAAYRTDREGVTLPALGVKFKLDDRRRIFAVSNQVCTDTSWQTAQAVWKSSVWSQVIRNPTG